MKHDSEAYTIVIKARGLLESAMNLYHSASRGESSASYWQDSLESELEELEGAIKKYKESLT